MWSGLVNGALFLISSFTWSPPHFSFVSVSVPYYCANAVVTISGSAISVSGDCAVDRIFANNFQS